MLPTSETRGRLLLFWAYRHRLVPRAVNTWNASLAFRWSDAGWTGPSRNNPGSLDHGDSVCRLSRRLEPTLSAVTAAVVGGVINLAVWFGLQRDLSKPWHDRLVRHPRRASLHLAEWFAGKGILRVEWPTGEAVLKSESTHPSGGAVRFRLPEMSNNRTRRSPEFVVRDYVHLTIQTQGPRGDHPNGLEF
jgi:hypothetical protein